MKGKLARAPHRRKQHSYERGEVFISDIMGPINITGMPQDIVRYFISFVDTATRYAYVATITSRKQAAQMTELFLNKIQETTGTTPKWLVSDNAGETRRQW